LSTTNHKSPAKAPVPLADPPPGWSLFTFFQKKLSVFIFFVKIALSTFLCTGLGVECLPKKMLRIGGKIISLRKIQGGIEQILRLRTEGYSQQEVADYLQIDRPFISRLERMGEVRKGKKIAVVGFPLLNKEEIKNVAAAKGVDYVWVMNEAERWKLVQEKSALEFFNFMMDSIRGLQVYDIVVLIGSQKWAKLAEALLDSQVVFLNLGDSPISEDCFFDPDQFGQVLDKIT
jgi:transcriptional regulator with XRE-family HTH domain